MTNEIADSKTATRRKFLLAAGATAAAAVAAPSVVKAQGPISMRFQSTWPSKDIFHEYALDFAKKVNDMTGGDLKIEVLPAGAVVPAFQLLDAVSKGVLDGGHGVLVYHYGKNTALALWGSGPGYAHGRQHAARPGTSTAAARRCWRRSIASIGANVVSFPYAPLYSQPLGWFKKPIPERRRLQGPEVPHRRHLDRPVHRAWAPRSTRCRAAKSSPRWTAACSTRPSSTTPRRTARSASPTSPRSACCRATTRTPSSSKSRFNKTKFNALPPKMQAIIENAVEAASQDMSWKAIDRNSQDYIDAADARTRSGSSRRRTRS